MSDTLSLFVRISGDSKEAQKALDDLKGKFSEVFSSPTQPLQELGDLLASKLLTPLGLSSTAALGAAAGVGVLAGAAVGLGAAVASAGEALVSWTQTTGQIGSQLHDLSLESGISVERLSDLRYAAAVLGQPLDALTTAAYQLSRRIGEGSDQVRTGLERIGLSFESIKALSPDQQLVAISDAMRATGDHTTVSAAAMELFGRSGREVLPMLLEDLGGLVDESGTLGHTWSEENVEAAHEFEKASNRVSVELEALKVRIGTALLPELTAFANGLTLLTKAAPEVAAELVKMADQIVPGLSEMAALVKFVYGPAWADLKGEIATDVVLGNARAGVAEATKKAREQTQQYADITRQLAQTQQDASAPATLLAASQRALAAASGPLIAGDTALAAAARTAALEQFAHGKTVADVTDLLKQNSGGAAINVAALERLHQEYETGKAKSEAYRKAEDEIRGSEELLTFEDQQRVKALLERHVSEQAIAQDIHQSEAAVKAYVASEKSAETADKNWTELKKQQAAQAQKTTVEIQTEAQKRAAAIDKVIADTLTGAANAQKQYQQEIDDLNKSDYDKEVARLARKRQAELDSLNTLQGDHQGAIDQVNAEYAAGMRLLEARNAQTFNDMKRPPLDWMATLSTAFASIPQQFMAAFTGGGGIGGALKSVSTSISDAFGKSIFGKGSSLFKSVWTWATGISDGFGQVAKALLPELGGIIGSIGSALMGSGNVLASAAGGGLNGAMMGAALGSIFPGLGTALGAGIGAVAGGVLSGLGSLIKGKPEWQKAADEIGRDFGVAVSEETAKAIAADADKMFSGDRSTAIEYNLAKVIKDAGGVTTANVDEFTSKLRDVFSFISRGQMTVAEGTTVIDDTFQELADKGTNALGLLSDKLKEIISLNQQYGTESTAITSYLKTQSGDVTAGFDAIAKGETVQTEALKAAQDALASNTDSSKVDELQQAVDTAKAKVTTTQEDIDRLARLGTDAFTSALAGGESLTEALSSISGGVDEVSDAVAATGLNKPGGIFGNLVDIETFTKNNADVMSGVDGVTKMLTGLANSNLMTQQSAADLGATLAKDYQTMTAGGLSADEAMLSEKTALQTLWELENKYHYTLDASTQSLLDQAEAAGVVGEKNETWQEKLVTDLDKIVGKFDTLLDSISDTGKALGNLNGQTVSVKVREENEDATGVTIPSHVRSYDVGGLIREDQLASIHAGELIGPVDFMKRALSGAMTELGVATSSNAMDVTLNIAALDTEGVDRVVQNKVLPRLIEALRNNSRGSLTNMRLVLGVS